LHTAFSAARNLARRKAAESLNIFFLQQSHQSNQVLFMTVSRTLFAVITLSFGFAGLLPAQENTTQVPVSLPENFSVTMHIDNLQGTSQKVEAKIYKLGGKQRTDFTNMPGAAGTALSGQMYAITDIESGETITVMPAQKMYMSMNLNEMGLADQSLEKMMERTGKMRFEKLAEEEVNGVRTVKYKATDPENAQELMMWVDPKTEFPVKVHVPNQETTVNYRDFSTDQPDASLFEIPQDYQKLPGLNPDMMKGMMQKLQNQTRQ
jgi:outer membrane lipoprotein-sorting protein